MIQLPGDIEPHLIDGFEWSDSAVYALVLDVPSDLREQWENFFDTTPNYIGLVEEKPTTVYVGAAKNVRARLEDHVEGERRKARLVQFCEIESIRNIWWFRDHNRAFERESGIAIAMQNEYPSYYVHSR